MEEVIAPTLSPMTSPILDPMGQTHPSSKKTQPTLKECKV